MSPGIEDGPAVGALAEAVSGLWRAFGRPEGLMDSLPADAALTRAADGEMLAAMPRLLELWINKNTQPVAVGVVLSAIADHWTELAPDKARAVEHLADVYWESTLANEPGPTNRADEVLGELSHFPLPMVRWFDPWLNMLDGTGARHLAEAILRPSSEVIWAERIDGQQQFVAWAASEPVVMGLTMVGGVHLDDGDLSQLFDQLI